MKLLAKKISKEPFTLLFRQAWRFADDVRGKFSLALFLGILTAIIESLEPLILALLINEIQGNSITNDNLWYIFLLIGVLFFQYFFTQLLQYITSILNAFIRFMMRLNISKYLLDGVFSLGLEWHSQRDGGDTVDKISRSSSALSDFCQLIFWPNSIIISATRFIVSLFAVTYLSPSTFFFIITAFVIIFFISGKFEIYLFPKRKTLYEKYNRTSGKVFDSMSNIISIIALRLQNAIIKNLKSEFYKPFDLHKKISVVQGQKNFCVNILFQTVSIGVFSFYVYTAFQAPEAILLGSIVAIFLYLNRLTGDFSSLVLDYTNLFSIQAKLENSKELEKDFTDMNLVQKKREGIGRWDEIVLKNVNFRYEDNETKKNNLEFPVFRFKKGEKVALLGKSGSGKTTFLKILHGLYANAQADILLDGAERENRNLDTYDFKTLLVPQESELFSSSIENNLTFGLEFKKKEIQKVLDIAEFSPVLQVLPKGLQSIINEKGVNLSGGQKQRLALARAFLFGNEKDILLLDESTSSVDSQTEISIYKNILKEFKEKTILASIHKLNIIKYFDRIVLFNNGTITDEGTFEDLLKRNAQFRHDWEEYIKE